jgi:hypothetical protein
VNGGTNPRFHKLISRFEALTGCPILINTSFNVRSEPIVCTPEDAIRCFEHTGLDVLVIGNCVVRKIASDGKAVPEKTRTKEIAFSKKSRAAAAVEGTETELKWFGVLFAVFNLAIALVFIRPLAVSSFIYTMWFVLVAILVGFYYTVAKIQPTVYRSWMFFVRPIGKLVTNVLLSLVYVFCFIPIGMMMKLVGYDPLQRKFEKTAASYWIERESDSNTERYFKQY